MLTSFASWGSLGSNRGQFNNPADLAIDYSANIIFVADIGNNRIQKFDTSGKFLGMWGSYGRGFGQFDHTGDIALDMTGQIVYVTDIGNHRVQKFDYDGKFISSWGSFGTGEGRFNRPAGLEYDSSGIVFVVDTMNNRIQKFDTHGNFLGMWGKAGKETGQFDNPVSANIDTTSNYLYISDSGNKRIEIFDKNGKYINEWGLPGIANGQFKRPVSVSFADNGQVYVVDKDRGDIQVFGASSSNSEPASAKVIKKTTTTVKKEGQEQPSKNSPETHTTEKLYIEFSDVFSYYGKTTVTIKNSDGHKTLGKHTFDFAQLHETQKDSCCHSQMSFDGIGKKGDRLEVDSIDPSSNGGSVSDRGSLTFDPSKHSYHLDISLDEFGCADCD